MIEKKRAKRSSVLHLYNIPAISLHFSLPAGVNVATFRRQDGTDGDDWFYGMAIADDNTVVLVGHTAGDFGAVNPGSHDVVAIKLNATDGREIWRYQARPHAAAITEMLHAT